MNDWLYNLPRFTYPEDFKEGDTILLEATESHHVVNVLRMAENESLILIDGKGKVARAEIKIANRKRTAVLIIETRMLPPTSQVQLCLGISKGGALETAVRRCTELGVASFQPLVTQHSMAANGWNAARWEKVVHEVAKQCQAPHFPSLEPARDLSSWLSERDPKRTLVFCSEGDRKSRPPLPPGPVDLLIGSEGGWSASEIESIKSKLPLVWGLGPHRLRVETASLVALSLVKAQLGELD